MATFGKVKKLYYIPEGVALATLTDYEMPSSVKSLGRITGDDGLAITQLRGDGTNIYDDNGDVALVTQGDVEQATNITFLDIDTNETLNKLLYGAENVKIAEDGSFSINQTGEYAEPTARFVFDIIDGNGNKRRVFINGKLKQSAEETYKYNEAVIIGCTISGEPSATDDFITREDGTILGLRAGDYRGSAVIQAIPEV